MKKLSYYAFLFIKRILRLLFPTISLNGTENIPNEPCIIVANHSQMYGPIFAELHSPVPRKTWCAGDIMNVKTAPKYCFTDFWSQKPKYQQPFFKLASYLIAPLCAIVFNNAETIGVYHDNRVITTFRKTVEALEDGKSIIIFPEYDKENNNIIYSFQNRFIDVARLWTKKSEKPLPFVPLYISPRLKGFYFGKPTYFDADSPIDEERERISQYLQDSITDIARSLPEHTVVPYRNIPKKLYPSNRSYKEEKSEKADS